MPPPQVLRSQSQAGELEARETGDEKARDHGKEEEERRNAVSSPFAFPSSLALLPLSQWEGDVWERDRCLTIRRYDHRLKIRPSEYVVYGTACVYKELYKVTDRQKYCVNNCFIWIHFSYLKCVTFLSLVPILKPFCRRRGQWNYSGEIVASSS